MMTETAILDVDNAFKRIISILNLITGILAFALLVRLNRPIFFPTDVPGDGVRLREGSVDDKFPSASSDHKSEFQV
jgi:hypothetical protein